MAFPLEMQEAMISISRTAPIETKETYVETCWVILSHNISFWLKFSYGDLIPGYQNTEHSLHGRLTGSLLGAEALDLPTLLAIEPYAGREAHLQPPYVYKTFCLVVGDARGMEVQRTRSV